MTSQNLPLNQIRVDLGTQMRVERSDGTIAEYAEALERGDTLPPIIVYKIEGEYVLVDGFHRYYAYRKLGRDTILCEIIQGTFDDAREYACCANKAHGLRRSEEDKRNAVQTFFGIPGRDTQTNSEVAKKLGVSVPFVKKVRNEFGIKASPAAHHGRGSEKWQEEARLNGLILPDRPNADEDTGLNGLISPATKNGSKTINIDLPIDKPHEFIVTLMEHVDSKFLMSCRDYLNNLLQ